MTKLRSFRFPEDKLARLKEIAKRKHDNNQTQALMEAIDRYYKELTPPTLQGFIRIDRMSSVNLEDDCPGCGGSESDRGWIAVYSDGTVRGVLCDECVEAGRA
jgi:hypothetical protein